MDLTCAVAAPPSATFDAIADFATLAEWDPFVRRVSLVEGRALEPGAVYALTAVGGLTLRYLVVECAPPHHVTYRGGTRHVTSVDRIVVAADGAGSRVTISTELAFAGWTRLIGPIMRWIVQLGGRFVSLPALRRYVEAV